MSPAAAIRLQAASTVALSMAARPSAGWRIEARLKRIKTIGNLRCMDRFPHFPSTSSPFSAILSRRGSSPSFYPMARGWGLGEIRQFAGRSAERRRTGSPAIISHGSGCDPHGFRKNRLSAEKVLGPRRRKGHWEVSCSVANLRLRKTHKKRFGFSRLPPWPSRFRRS